MVGVVKCDISSYRAGFVDWDFAIGKHSARTIMGIMIPYTLCIIMWYQEINITDNYVYIYLLVPHNNA
jgi:hypothetical protein